MSVRIDGTALSPEEEYNLESAYLFSAQEVEYGEYTSSIVSPGVGRGMEIIAAVFNFAVCFLRYYGVFALIIYSVLLSLRKYVKDLQEQYKLLLKYTNQLAEGHLDAPIEGESGCSIRSGMS